ncbi:hypothetical protein [Streptomyces sp. NBC_01500]|uniref:hypothetical protein n=1 Tax=Streptomyces sp. NBC_01500 TaxID=2903886 RepID=UPI0022594438|nr:hypothetical protein [Streptomyces sp. NBC_01500]MCX4547655.1 hypothetical protein [Streptomyces sp. NBC_01500]
MAEGDTDFFPGCGPASRIAISLTVGTLQAIRGRVGKRGVSAYLERAAQRQVERDSLNDLNAEFDQANGPADPEVVAVNRAKLTWNAPSTETRTARLPAPSSWTARAWRRSAGTTPSARLVCKAKAPLRQWLAVEWDEKDFPRGNNPAVRDVAVWHRGREGGVVELKLFNTKGGLIEAMPHLAEVEADVQALIEAHMDTPCRK